MNKFTITLNPDGSVSVDSTKMKGSTSDIKAELNALARILGGDLRIERHVPGAHSHHSHDDHDHTHN